MELLANLVEKKSLVLLDVAGERYHLLEPYASTLP
jgi:hypothetical protein